MAHEDVRDDLRHSSLHDTGKVGTDANLTSTWPRRPGDIELNLQVGVLVRREAVKVGKEPSLIAPGAIQAPESLVHLRQPLVQPFL